MSNLSVKELFRTEYRNLRSACRKLGELEQKALSARDSAVEMLAYAIAGALYLVIAPFLFPVMFVFFLSILLLVVALVWSIADPSMTDFWSKGAFTFEKFFAELREDWGSFNILEQANRFYFIATHPSTWGTEPDKIGIACLVIFYVMLLAFLFAFVTYLFQLVFYALRRNHWLTYARSSYEAVENLQSAHQLRLKTKVKNNLNEINDYLYS